MTERGKALFARRAHRLLDALDESFFNAHHCVFAGGSRIAIDLDMHRMSGDVDLFCTDADAFFALRRLVDQDGIAQMFKPGRTRFQRLVKTPSGDAIRGFVDTPDGRIKVDIVHQDPLGTMSLEGLSVPVISREVCICEKLLANANRGADTRYGFRDIIDLAFMCESWSERTFRQGLALANERHPSRRNSQAEIAFGVKNAIRCIIHAPKTWNESLADMEVAQDGRLHKGLGILLERFGLDSEFPLLSGQMNPESGDLFALVGQMTADDDDPTSPLRNQIETLAKGRTRRQDSTGSKRGRPAP